MNIVVYCNIWQDGLGDFGHFKDVVNRLLESYGSSIKLFGVVIYDSSVHNCELLKQDLQGYNSLPHFSWRLLDNPTKEKEDARLISFKDIDDCLLSFKDIMGIIVVSTPFYVTDNQFINSLPILHFPEHEAASFFKDYREISSIDFNKLIFSMGLHEASHGFLLKSPRSVSSEALLASLEDIKYHNFLLATNSREKYSQFLQETLIVPIYVTQQGTTFAYQVITSILVSELAEKYQNIIFHTNLELSEKKALIALLKNYCSELQFLDNEGTVTEDKFSTHAKYKKIKVALNYPLPSSDYESLFWIAQEVAVGRGDKTLELMVSNPNIIPIVEVQYSKVLTFEAFNRYIVPNIFEGKETIESIRSYISWLLRASPSYKRYPFSVKFEPNIDPKNLEAFLTHSMKFTWKNIKTYLAKYLDFNIKLDFYLLLFFKKIVIVENNPNQIFDQDVFYSQLKEEKFSFYQFAYKLLYVPEDKRKPIIEKAYYKLSNSYQLAVLLILLPEKERYDFLMNLKFPECDSKLIEIFMYFLPSDKRLEFYCKYKSQIIDVIKDNLYVIKSIAKLFSEEVQWSFINDLSDKLIDKLEQKNYFEFRNILYCIPHTLRLKFILTFIYKSDQQLEALNDEDIIEILSDLNTEDRITFFNKFSCKKVLSLCKYNIKYLMNYLPSVVDLLSQYMINSNVKISEQFTYFDSFETFLSLIEDNSYRDRFINFLLKEKTFIELIKSDYSLTKLFEFFSGYNALPQLVALLKEKEIIEVLKTSVGEKRLFNTLIDCLPEVYYQASIDLFGGLEKILKKEIINPRILSKLSSVGVINLVELLDKSELHETLAKIIIGSNDLPLTHFSKNHPDDFINFLITKLSPELSKVQFSDYSFRVVFNDLHPNCHKSLISAVGAKKIVVDIGEQLYHIRQYEHVYNAYSLALKLQRETIHVSAIMKKFWFFLNSLKPKNDLHLKSTCSPKR